jgi:catechol 2,3-dioxygenase-like lactoylglutathione lyase family enzyme
MKIAFVAGFGPIVRDMDASYAYWNGALGIGFDGDPGYWHTDKLEGVKAFALWRLEQAAESTFGTDAWPADIPEPQAWLELDVDSVEGVTAAVEEMRAAGHRVLRDAHEEPWGQTTSRLLSPEGLLVGITYTPWMHRTDEGPITES